MMFQVAHTPCTAAKSDTLVLACPSHTKDAVQWLTVYYMLRAKAEGQPGIMTRSDQLCAAVQAGYAMPNDRLQQW